MRNNEGSVLVLTMLIMGLVTVFTQQLMRSSFVGTYFNRTMMSQEHAKMLALGGIEIAMAQLVLKKLEPKAGEPGFAKATPAEGKKEEQSDQQMKLFLQTILPHLNRWQEFNLQPDIDGIEGQIKLCISCEEGKINLNDAFDFKKGEFKKEIAAMLKPLATKGKLAPGVLLKKMSEYLQKRKRPIDDISEFLTVQGFENFDLFYKPPKRGSQKIKSVANTDISFFDLFTIWTKKNAFEPLFLSDSMCAVLGLRRPIANDVELIKDKFKQVIESFKKDWGKDWEANWKYMQIIYDQKPAIFKDIKDIFSQEFEPRTYSVLSCGNVGGVERSVLAIIEINPASKTDQKDDGKPESADKTKEEPGPEQESKKKRKRRKVQ